MKRKFIVVSLFNGMNCGRIALERFGFNPDIYISSEINEAAIKITQHHYPDTIQIWDVKEVRYKNGILYYSDKAGNRYQKYLGHVDLFIGGSPCQDLSVANTKGEGLKGPKSGLFFEFLRLKKEMNPTYFLLENVPMKNVWKDLIDNLIGVNRFEMNSNLFSAQNRRRLYWTNITGITEPKDKGIVFSDIIFKGEHRFIDDKWKLQRIAKTKYKMSSGVFQFDISGRGHKSQYDRAYPTTGKIGTLSTTSGSMKIALDPDKGIYRRIHIVEAERLQNVEDNYTNVPGISLSNRFAVLGNGWTVDAISHIFSFINFKKSKDEDLELESV